MAKINGNGRIEEPTQEEQEGLESSEAFHTLERNSLDLHKCFTEEPAPLDFVLPGFVLVRSAPYSVQVQQVSLSLQYKQQWVLLVEWHQETC